MVECLIFDLDETIYPRDTGLMRAISERISQYMIERLNMDPEIVPGLRRAYWEQYGTTSRGLQLLHGIDVQDYMEYVHDLDVAARIQFDADLSRALDGLPQRKVIFTNATTKHAQAVLRAMRISHHFDAIYDAFFFGNESKPAPEAYRRLLIDLGLQGTACLLAEDSARNLYPARELGMVTVLVDPLPGTEFSGIDYVIRRIAEIEQVVTEIGAKQKRCAQ
jgi:putative hydrolase of the HAD superfamily